MMICFSAAAAGLARPVQSNLQWDPAYRSRLPLITTLS